MKAIPPVRLVRPGCRSWRVWPEPPALPRWPTPPHSTAIALRASSSDAAIPSLRPTRSPSRTGRFRSAARDRFVCSDVPTRARQQLTAWPSRLKPSLRGTSDWIGKAWFATASSTLSPLRCVRASRQWKTGSWRPADADQTLWVQTPSACLRQAHCRPRNGAQEACFGRRIGRAARHRPRVAPASGQSRADWSAVPIAGPMFAGCAQRCRNLAGDAHVVEFGGLRLGRRIRLRLPAFSLAETARAA